jgi:alcohol dehydrogenase
LYGIKTRVRNAVAGVSFTDKTADNRGKNMRETAAYQFSTVPNIVSESGASATLGKLISTQLPTARRALIVTDAGLWKTGILEAPRRSLEACGIAVHMFTDVVADPPEAVVEAAIQKARAIDADLVIGLGGGSSMDVAKLVAALAPHSQPLKEAYGIGHVRGKRLPLVQVPTTAGTGSEVTNIAIVTTGETTKMGVVAPQLYADIAVLDATMTLGLPPAVTAATGIDAMVHAIEAFTSRHKKNPMSDMLARQALGLLSTHLLTACEDGRNLAARQGMLLGACLAGQAFSNAPVAAVHALAYPVGGIFHVPHGLSNSLVLPHVLGFNMPNAAPHYAELAGIVAPGTSGSPEARGHTLIAALQQIAQHTRIATTLRQVGITDGDLDRLADDAMLQTRLLGNNPREVTRDDARAIYAAAL